MQPPMTTETAFPVVRATAMRAALYLCVLAPLASALRAPTPGAHHPTRRAVLSAAAAGCATTLLPSLPASAALTADLKEAEGALMAATDKDATMSTLGRLLQIGEDYNGMPTDKLRQEVVEAMRAKRDVLRGEKQWDGILEEQYQRVMRVVDPWRVVELRPLAQGSVFVFPLVYGALLAVQQLLPKAFAPAYAAGAALIFGPLVFELIAR